MTPFLSASTLLGNLEQPTLSLRVKAMAGPQTSDGRRRRSRWGANEVHVVRQQESFGQKCIVYCRKDDTAPIRKVALSSELVSNHSKDVVRL